jgi:hypothetical protein
MAERNTNATRHTMVASMPNLRKPCGRPVRAVQGPRRWPGSREPFVEAVRREVPDLGRRSLTLGDFEACCGRLEIEVIYLEMEEVRGVSFYEQGVPFIGLNSVLPRPEMVVTAFHELTHLLAHPFTEERFSEADADFSPEVYELEANVVGVVALIPDEAAPWPLARRLVRRYGVTPRTAHFRLWLGDDWRAIQGPQGGLAALESGAGR